MKPLTVTGATQSEECSTSGHESVVVTNPDPDRRAKVMVSEGCGHEKAQDWEAAIGCYRDAVLADAEDPRVRYFAHNNLGYSLIQLHRYDEAEDHCEAAIAINPAQYNAHKNLGLARAGQGRWLDAALSLAEAARLCPDEPRAWLHLQKLLAERPGLLDQSAQLRGAFDELMACYESSGTIPRYN
jgi:tetratricopeptide (TPR) repeat protein